MKERKQGSEPSEPLDAPRSGGPAAVPQPPQPSLRAGARARAHTLPETPLGARHNGTYNILARKDAEDISCSEALCTTLHHTVTIAAAWGRSLGYDGVSNAVSIHTLGFPPPPWHTCTHAVCAHESLAGHGQCRLATSAALYRVSCWLCWIGFPSVPTSPTALAGHGP